jgi:hypothetical protein
MLTVWSDTPTLKKGEKTCIERKCQERKAERFLQKPQ